MEDKLFGRESGPAATFTVPGHVALPEGGWRRAPVCTYLRLWKQTIIVQVRPKEGEGGASTASTYKRNLSRVLQQLWLSP